MPHDETFYSHKAQMPIELNKEINNNIARFVARTICRFAHIDKRRLVDVDDDDDIVDGTRNRSCLVTVAE